MNPPDLATEYERVCSIPSDISAQLPVLVDIIVGMGMTNVLELGTRTGVSTIGLLHALEQTGGRLTSVDLDERPPIGEFDHWQFIQGDDMSSEVLAQLDGPFDMVFLDTSHLYKETCAEIRLYQHLVRPGGVFSFHDVNLEWPEGSSPADGPFPVRRAIEEYAASEHREWVNTGDWPGLGIMKF